MKPNMRFLWRIIALHNIVTVYAGFGDPRKARGLLRKQYGQPCDCRGGQISEPPSDRITQVTCSGKTAYLMPDQSWKCKSTPRDTSPNGPLLECPCSSFQSSVHSSCYTSYQQCKSGNKTYYTATLLKTQTGSTNDVQVLGTTNKLVQSSCNGQKGKPVCWSTTAPIHISDGGGPLDIARIKTVQKKLEKIHKALYPELQYHPLALPEIRDNFRLDAQTFDILNATYNLLQMSNTSLAHDCWLCLKMGPPIPLAIPNFLLSYVNYSNESLVNNSCPIISPLLVQPMTFSNSFCLFSPSYNSTKEIDLGYVVFDNCTSIIHATDPLCAVNGSVFVCGNNMAYTYLPTNWTGLCVLATLLPDIDIIPGDEPIPIPAIEHFIYRPKRAIQFIPLLAGLGITTAFTTGATGLGVSLTQYTKLSNQLISDVQTLSSTIQDLQDQVDSLAEVVLQNRRGLDLLTAEQGGICLALQEKCCFYANKSGIVRDKIKTLQEELEKRRKGLAANPLWTGLDGLLPYLLPFLGPLLTLLLFLTLGPIILNKLMAFVRQQIEAFQAKPIQVHYHHLEMTENGESYLPQ